MTRETTEERTRKRWKRALDLFDQSFLLAPTEREQLLNTASEQEPELRPMLDQLFLASRDAESGGFLESPAWSYQPVESNPQAMVGRQIGAYRLTQYLAKGGMGIVYQGERADQFFRRQVAVKFINADTGPKHYARFRREVQILADLKHPNLVMLYDAGRLGDGRPYIVMEYVEGENLRDWSERRGPISAAKVVEIIKQACAGLHAAHEAGVIHRDIKPANIAISENGGKLTVKVLDFGVAARKQHDGSGVSSTQGAIGTLMYMSPEQLQPTPGNALTPASDVYALGLTAYELLTGSPANNGLSQGEIITKHLYEMPEPPSRRRSDLNIPPSFDRAILKALAKNPGERYQSALEFAAALEEVFKQRTVAFDTSTENLRNQSQPPKPAQAQPSKQEGALPVVPPPQKPADQLQGSGGTGKRKALTPILAVAALLVVATIAVFFAPSLLNQLSPPRLESANQSKNGPLVTPAASKPKQLKLSIKVRNEFGSPLDKASIAIFKPGITTLPQTIDENNAIILRTNAQGSVDAQSPDLMEGSYLVKITHARHKTSTGTIKLVEDPARPGIATLTITLGAE